MTTRSERDKSKAQQERHQMILSQLLKDEDNKYCVDCDAKGPRWASWNLGVFLCIRCAGIHRNLGVHITKVKSVNLDSWTSEQCAMVQEIGNSRARAVYEANLPDHFRRPQTDSSLEAFIRAKYEQKKYMAQGWVPPKPTVHLDDHCLLRPTKPLKNEDETKKDKKRNRPRPVSNVKLTVPQTTSTKASTPPHSHSAPSLSPTQQSAPQPEPVVAKKESNIDDLLGLDSPSAVPSAGDLFSDFMSAPATAPASVDPASQPASSPQEPSTDMSQADSISGLFSNDTSSNLEVSQKTSKESILALYGSGGGGGQGFNMANAGGMYGGMNMQQNGMMANGMQANMGMMGMPQQQQQQQQQQHMMNMQPPPANLMVVDPLSELKQSLATGNSPSAYYQGGQQMSPGMGGMIQMPTGSSGMMGMQQQQQPQQQQQQMMGQQQQPNMYNMNMYNMQQVPQVQQQMSGLNLGTPSMGSFNTAGTMNGWSAPQPTGQTLSTNLWQ